MTSLYPVDVVKIDVKDSFVLGSGISSNLTSKLALSKKLEPHQYRSKGKLVNCFCMMCDEPYPAQSFFETMKKWQNMGGITGLQYNRTVPRFVQLCDDCSMKLTTLIKAHPNHLPNKHELWYLPLNYLHIDEVKKRSYGNVVSADREFGSPSDVP